MRPAAVESSRINLVFSVKMKIVDFVVMRQPLLSLRLITIICGMSEIVFGGREHNEWNAAFYNRN